MPKSPKYYVEQEVEIHEHDDLYTAGVSCSDHGYKIEIHDQDRDKAKGIAEKVAELMNEIDGI